MLELTHCETTDYRRLLQAGRYPWLARLTGRSLAWLYRRVGKDRYDDFRLEKVAGAPFIVMPSVFNPKVPRTGAFLASYLSAGLVQSCWDVLDMGTGSGVCAVVAAKHARRVVAVDINAEAVRCATLNVHLNHAEGNVEVRQGDLFEAVKGERFDLIAFNPPFLRGAPRNDRDRAWRSSDVAERFAAGIGAHLKPGGQALVLLSSFGHAEHFLEQFRIHRLKIDVHAQKSFINEKLVLFRLSMGHAQ